MEQARLLLTALWEPFSFFSLFLYTGLALMLGAVAGLLLALKLHRLGWLARNNRWHHWLLKLYFLLLPLAGGFLGFQGGLLYGNQQQINRHLDSYAPLVQALADDIWSDFQTYVEAQEQQGLLAVRDVSVQTLLNQMALDYVRSERLQEAAERAEASNTERIAFDLLDRLRASLLGKAIGELAVEKTARYSGLNEKVLTQVLDARIEQLFQAEFLLGLLKQQVGHVFKPFYIVLLVQLGLLLALIAAEWGLSRWLRQMPAAPLAEPLALA
ncbi:hypothetical protein EQ836_18855 [Ectopseudomonas mendocina]|uniref:Transmembrane protein n=1 Tax=Ectopseudomonas mendocina TaxID=300 RepID=A0ABD7RSH2_ECTME|nr:hypothetical protein [Pseudomonas mendocina]TRO12429.1 hypothetical protein EQ829_14865 [Pseudomonas mendocina]TRO14838.1 hypothetical protein EQ836_18855 [Pseudomonas mendocina]